MVKTNKKFDCVEMKNTIQQHLRKEYEQRRSEFASYVDFINAAADESDEIRAFREKIARPKTSC